MVDASLYLGPDTYCAVCTAPGQNPNVSRVLGAIIVYQRRVTDCSKCRALVGDVDSREVVVCGDRVYANCSKKVFQMMTTGTKCPLQEKCC